MMEQHAAQDEIFLPLGGIAAEAALVDAAHALAQQMNYGVNAVFLGADDAAALMMSSDGVSGLGLGAVEALRSERQAAEARARAMAQGRAGVRYWVYDGPRLPGSGPARLSPFAMVDGDAARGVGPLSDVFQTLLMDDGAAVAVMRASMAPKRLGVAWDGSREAARALKMARDFVRAADEVVLLQADAALHPKDAACAPPEAPAAWIARRGPTTQAVIFPSKGGPGDELLRAAADHSVDMLIAGAYGNPRLREAVFGGVTRALLEAVDGPSLFLAH